MRYMTAGESHGEMLVGILEGLPAGITVTEEAIDAELARRQAGYGRGARMRIEHDAARIVAGVRDRKTLGSPIALLIENRDYENWRPYMDPRGCDTTARKVTAPRPGHADLVGALKFGTADARNVLERASARNTAMTVALGAVCKSFLDALGIGIGSYVTQIGAVASPRVYGTFDEIADADASPVRVLDRSIEAACIERIDAAASDGDTLGGTFTVVAHGVPSGIGSVMAEPDRLDAALCGALGGMPGIKAVSVGAGAAYAGATGSAIHDPIVSDGRGGFARVGNNAGGLEGGMSNGCDLVLNAVFKPIPTVRKGLATVDLETREATVSARERGDVCAVPSATVVAEAICALTLTKAILTAPFGTLSEVMRWLKR